MTTPSLRGGVLAVVLFFVLAGSIALRSELTVSDVELLPDGNLRVVFFDSSPPTPYGIEQRSSLAPDGVWTPWHGVSIWCVQPGRYETVLPGPVVSPVPDSRFFRIILARGSNPPLVVATEPRNQTTGVANDLDRVRVSFNRKMSGAASIQTDGQWGSSFVTWTDDHRTAEIHRIDTTSELPQLTTLNFTLNPEGSGFADLAGAALAPYTFSFTTALAPASGLRIVSTFPPNNERNVDPWIETIEFHFSEPMMPTGGFESRSWYPWTLEWSNDRQTAFVRRSTAGTPHYGQEVYLRPIFFRSISGELLPDDYVLSFKTADPPVQRIDSNPESGFYWPYFLMIPQTIEAPATLLVEPNNTGTVSDDPWFHEAAARKLINRQASFAIRLGSPLLVPAFPRPVSPPAPEPGGIYIHALDRYSLDTGWRGLERIDLQLLAMIDDAVERLNRDGIMVDEKVFLMGFSASGAFTSRLTLLHPQRIKAAAPGSPGGWPLAPVGSWQGTPLKYPMGIQDIESLTGQSFNLESFRQVPLYIYVGGADTNDAFDTRGMTAGEKNLVNQFLNWPSEPLLANRWPLAESIYNSVGANATFIVYPGVGHTITSSMYDDLLAFFRKHR